MNILNKIIKHKRCSLQKETIPGRFRDALSGRNKVSLIAEIKMASPSEGVICKDCDPVSLAKIYENEGASAISVVTDEEFFGGSLDMLKQVCASVNLPVLRKDFVVSEKQIYEAAFVGASAVLLIASVLDVEMLTKYISVVESLGMDALVEVHDQLDLEKAVLSGASIIGINNRDLKTFEVDLGRTRMLSKMISDDLIVVSESGICDAFDVRLLKGSCDAVLVGTSILKSRCIPAKVRELSRNRPLLKVCGVQDLETALFCDEGGVDFIGFNFIKTSPRYIEPDDARKIAAHLKNAKPVALFADEQESDFEFVQIHGDKPVIRGEGVAIPLFDLPKGQPGKIDLEKPFPYPSFIAGGLEAKDVVGLDVFAVDVARGVETNGRKDISKVNNFLKNLSL